MTSPLRILLIEDNLDDVVFQPDNVIYDAVTRSSRLEFSTALSRFRDPLDTTKFLQGSARLRISLSAAHDPELVDGLAAAIKSID